MVGARLSADEARGRDGPTLRRKIALADKILQRQFGTPQWRPRDPLDELIVTLLSQNTHDRNRDAAYRRLRERYPSWHAVLATTSEEIADAIRPAGLARQKSGRMLELLQWIRETFGGLTLDPLKSMGDDAIIALLTARKGIGVKTAAVMLAFALDRDVCPVDTHVHRIARRLGWVDDGATPEQTFYLLRPAIPKGRAPVLHLNLLKFGRTRCAARRPRCGGCPLWFQCEWEGKGEEGPDER